MLKRIPRVSEKHLNFVVQQRLQNNDQTSVKSGWIEDKSKLENKLNHLMRVYEEFIGLKEVKLAQAKVIEAETDFKRAQELRIKQQQQMLSIQKSLREIHLELDKTVRGEDRYLQLVTKEHALLSENKALLTELRITEKQEYDHFSMMSLALRESHEKERTQAEKTKYWSIIGSIMGTLIGALFSTISNRYRMEQLREMVVSASSGTSNCSELLGEMRDTFNKISHSEKNSENENKNEMKTIMPIEDSVKNLVTRTRYLEQSIERYSIINAGLLSTILVIVPLMSWLLSK